MDRNFYCTGNELQDNIIPITNIYDNQLRSANNYGLMIYPIGINGATTYPGLQNLKQKKIYFSMSGTAVSSDGFYCPATLEPIGPDEEATESGQIYDRYFLHEEIIWANHKTNAGDAYKTNTTGDSITFRNSIRDKETSNTYKKLINLVNQDGSPSDSPDTSVPTSMRTGIEALKKSQLKLSNDYLNGILIQLKTFFSMILKELNSPLAYGEICNLCLFKYDSHSTFPLH